MISVYTTCPAVDGDSPRAFRQRLVNTALWSEAAGCRGILTYTDNATLDPWIVARELIEHTETLVPLVAVNPVYTHPFAISKMISTIRFISDRRVDLNLVAGGFKRHLRQLGCRLTHDERYDRLTEFGAIITRLLHRHRPGHFRRKLLPGKQYIGHATPSLVTHAQDLRVWRL